MSTAAGIPGRWRPDPMTVAVAVLVLLAELAFVTVYVQAGRIGVARPLVAFVVPFVWINLSLLVFAFVRPSPDGGRRWPAAAISAGYFAVLAVAGGVFVFGAAGTSGGRVVLSLVPGWSPLFVLPGDPATLVVIPFKVIGYVALTYLVYVTVRDASGALVGGLVGIFSCVSCTFPVVAAVVSSLVGGGGALGAAYSNSYLLSTVVFAVTVALLSWRPSIGGFGPLERLRPG